MSSPIVRVLFQGRLLQCVPFTGDKLRIGRRKDNDIVINNLSVSRAHAELVREGQTIRLVDGGSENGCFVNGVRADQVEVTPGDELIIGKHQLLVEWGEAPSAAVPETPRSEDPQFATQIFSPQDDAVDDVFDAGPAVESATPIATPAAEAPVESSDQDNAAADAFMSELVGEEAPAAPEFSVSVDDSPASDFDAARAAFDVDPGPAGSADFAFPDVAAVAENEVEFPESSAIAAEEVDFAPALAAEEVDFAPAIAAEEVDFAPASASGEEPHGAAEALESELFDFAPLPADNAAQVVESHSAPEPQLDESATVTVRREGEPLRQIPWENPVLVIGRTGDCDIILADPKISRRHAELERNESGFWVRDLESINFTFVNGEKITERQLRAGDVVSIEGFELEVAAETLSGPVATPEAPAAVISNESVLTVEVDTDPGVGANDEAWGTEVEPEFELNDPVDEGIDTDTAGALDDHESSVDAEAADLLASLSPMEDPVDPPEDFASETLAPDVPDALDLAAGEANTDFALLDSPETDDDADQQAYTAFPEDPGPEREAPNFDSAGLDFGFDSAFGDEPDAAPAASGPDEDPPTLPPFESGPAAEESSDDFAAELAESFGELREPAPDFPAAPAADVFEEPGGQLRDEGGIDSLFDGDDLDEKPDEAQAVVLGDLTPQISFQPDPTQTPMPAGRICVELSLRTEELPPALRRLVVGLDAEDLRLPLEVKVRIEE